MISDEELKEFLAWKFDPNSHESAFQEMAQELLAYREAEQKNLMCWRKDYPEEGGICEDSLVDIIADELSDNDETTEEIQRAARLPNRKMRIWLSGGEDRVVHWEWVE